MKKLQVFFLFVFLLGCSSNQTISLTATPNVIKTPSPFPSQTAIPPTQTLTPTLTFTPTHTPFPSLTSFPAFSPDEGMAKLKSWLQGTEDCFLPCWGGITPGRTSWQEAKQLIETLSGFATVEFRENFECGFGKCNGIGWSLFPNTLANGGFYSTFSEDKIHVINITVQDAGLNKTNLIINLNLQHILMQYGTPTFLLFSTEPDLPGYEFLEIILVYPKEQFIIKYSKYAKITSEKVVSCGPDSSIELIVLDNREQLDTIDAIASAAETIDFHVDVWHKPVEEAMGISIDEFHETYSKANAPCISTPTNIWLP